MANSRPNSITESQRIRGVGISPGSPSPAAATPLVMANISDLPTLAWGTYIPTLTNALNITGSAPSNCMWIRLGPLVIVSGQVSVQATATGTNAQLLISLPIASDLLSHSDLAGTAFNGDVNPGNGCRVCAEATANAAAMAWIPQYAGLPQLEYSFTFQYHILP